MKLTRRTFIKLAGAAGVAGCAPGDEIASTDGEVPEDFDAGPDEIFDAAPIDPDAKTFDDVDDAARDDAATDGAVTDGAADAGAPLDAAADVPVDAPRDAGVDVPRDVPRDVGTDSGARVDAGRDAGPTINPDFRGLPDRPGQFPIGVMAGDATADSIIFWTRYDGDAALTLRVLEMDGSRIVAMRFNGRVTPSGAGYVRAIVTGLRPNKQHLYAFLLGGATSPNARSLVGRVQTAIAADSMATVTFAGTSCSNQSNRPFPVLQHAGSRTDLDFFIHAGDHTYTDHGDNATTLGQYRGKYAENWGSAGLKSLHRSTGMYLTWDDHEVFNNWNPETVSAARLAAARQAFFEHRATRRSATDANRIWRSFRWGRSAEIFILDCRSERRPSTRSLNPSRNSQYLSRTQMNWLKAGLRESPCVFKFIVSSVPIVDRAGADSDNWNGYASQRQEILSHINNNNLRGVVWLSGDVHFGGVCSVEASGPWSDIWEVIMGPAGANRDGRPPVRESQFPVLVHNVHNYTVLRANPTTRTLDVEFINAAGHRIAGSHWSRRL
ncbi:MAG: Phosphodiesterase/alkaline phosphatase [Myxococcaceae bacterium]|nr:Phosphodiesterase/alkaline phosphatase [Myxococcaceae bacterium]